MRYKRATRYVLVLALATVAPMVLLSGMLPAHAAGAYALYVLPPYYAQEGGTNTFWLSVTNANATTYRFQFTVQDPQSKTFKSILYNYTNPPGQTSFTLPAIAYPSPGFLGPSSLVGTYNLSVDQVAPVVKLNVATNSFQFILTNTYVYARTQTVMIHATGYNVSENVNVAIRPLGSTNVFSQNLMASSTGTITTNWKIPWNATLGYYVVQLTGTSTVKNPADIQGILVVAAPITISSFASSKSTYQRTETMQFSFQAAYPDNSNATTGAGIITLMRPDGSRFNITASYNAGARDFVASYKTSATDLTGTWNATMGVNYFDDGVGNTGPSQSVSTLPQLIPATLSINANVTTYVAVGQTLRLNATITYPDGTALQSGLVGAYMLYSGSPTVNDTVSITFDSGLQRWVGSYALQSTDPGGLWTLVIRASDSSTPANTGSASKAVTTQDHPPVASFNASPSSAPTGTPISFDATSSYDPDGTVTAWSWTFGDGNTGSGLTTSHSYNTAGTYTIALTVTDNSGSTGTTTVQITITDRPPIASFTPSPTSAPTLIPISFDGTASTDPDGTVTTWAWNFGDGNSGTGSTTTHTYSTAGTYTVTLTVTDNSGSIGSTTVQITITDRPPIASFTPSTTSAPTGTSISFDGTTSSDPDGTVTAWSWTFGDGSSGSGSITSHTYNTPGTFTVTLVVTDNSGSTGTTTSQVTIDRPPIASFSQSATSAPTGTTISFNGTASYDPDGTVATWSWAFGDGATGTGSTASHTYTTAGTLTVTLTVVDNAGWTGSTTSQITITDRAPVASFNPSTTSVPTGTSISFDGTSSYDPDGTVTAWSWTFGDGATAAGSTTTHAYSTPGTYSATLTVTDNGGLTASKTAQITITDRAPLVTWSSSPANPSSGQRVTLSITASDPDGSVTAIRVDWGDGTIDTLSGSATSDTHTYTLSGSTSKSFTINVTATDNGGQTSIPSSSTVTVQPSPTGSGGGIISLPLYLFGILAVVIGAVVAGGFLAFRRHRVTHARLKIDLEAVKSEAGRIENQDFFQSVKDQLKKEKDE